MTAPNLIESLPEIAALVERAGSILVGLDFDGTLEPIRPRPEDVVLGEAVRATLARLAQLPHVHVMIASGRSLADIRSRVGLPQLIYAGNHGLEIEGCGLEFREPAAVALAGRVEGISQDLEVLLANIPGVLVEKKGLTTSVHYRNVPSDQWEEIAQTTGDVVAANSLHFYLAAGHRVIEIRPRVNWHKGSAVKWVLDRLHDRARRLVFYIGDDQTDEDAFASLPDGVTAKVGPGSSAHARFALADPAAVQHFLEWLLLVS